MARPRTALRPRTGLLRRLSSFLGALLVLHAPALATWSIVVLNHKTGEVCVATATCIPDFQIRRYVPVIRVGLGAGAAQSWVDSQAYNRGLIWDALEEGATPDRVLQRLLTVGDSPQDRQYGIVAFTGEARTFSGTNCGAAVANLTGEVGDLSYAIQGNLLVGWLPVLDAETALLNTPGDLATKVMAAMQAARFAGGDGRCSCSPNAPTSCGEPPASFVHSSHCATMVIARMGDIDGVCNIGSGCANGTYYMRRNWEGGVNDIDAVEGLQERWDVWRANLQGRPDAILSEVAPKDQRLPADGLSTTLVTVRMVDVEGVPLVTGGATVTLEPRHEGADPAVPGPVTDHGDGTYTFELTSTGTPGTGEWGIRVDDGIKPVLLWPPLSLEVDPPAELHCGRDSLGAAEGGAAALRLQRPVADAGRGYQLLVSAAGTTPGTTVGGVLVPLNADRAFGFALAGQLRTTVGEGFLGSLDATGRAEAAFHLDPQWAWTFIGETFHFAALLADQGQGLEVVGPVGFTVEP